jgi:hypothetical protein
MGLSARSMSTMNRASARMHTAWAGAAVLLVLIGLWLVVAAGLQRELPQLVPLPEGPITAHEAMLGPASQPLPLPGGNGHLEISAEQVR